MSGFVIPTHYTDEEGSRWIEWTRGSVHWRTLEHLHSVALAMKLRRVIIREVCVHAFSIGNPATGEQYFRWDCRNGITRPWHVATHREEGTNYPPTLLSRSHELQDLWEGPSSP